jgi:putative tryptophan/tyrosine transport system substrate-binding protein
MRRRSFLGFLGASAVAWPVMARAQPAAMPRIGFLSSRSANDSARMLRGLQKGLAEQGFVEGQNIAIAYRWADGHYDRLAPLAQELLNSPIAVLVAGGGEPAARTAVAAKTKTPIVTVFASDPVSSGMIESLSHPGHNVTGVSIQSASIEPKRIGLLHDVLPQAKAFGVLLNPATPTFAKQLDDVEAACRGIGLEAKPSQASNDGELEAAFEAITRQPIDALLVSADPFFLLRRARISELAARMRVPVMYPYRDFPEAGGLMSYGIDLADSYRQMAVYAGRILKGDRPESLPVAEPIKYEFVINLKTKNALGFAIPPGVLAIADEVIE